MLALSRGEVVRGKFLLYASLTSAKLVYYQMKCMASISTSAEKVSTPTDERAVFMQVEMGIVIPFLRVYATDSQASLGYGKWARK